MKITLLQKMLKYPTLRNWSNEGLNLDEINILEQKYNSNKEFPKALREYLYIAGRQSNLGDIDTGLGYDWMQKTAKKELDEIGKIIERPFFVISQLDACTQFGFIYLDEPSEDPIKYNCYAHKSYWDDGTNFIEPSPSGTLSSFINVCIDRAIEDDNFINGR